MPDQIDVGLKAPGERLDLLFACLSFGLPAERLTALRFALLSEPGALDGLMLAANRRLLGPAALDGLAAKGLLHPSRGGKPGTTRAKIAELVDIYAARRETLRAGLADIVAALNGVGIEPLIVKGSVSLLTGEPAWRFQRDIDFLVEPGEAQKTVAALESIGFVAVIDEHLPDDHHHLQPMWREGLPVGVEPHLRINTGWARRVLPDELIVPQARSATFGELKVRLLRDEHAMLYGLVHHHFQHHGALYGVIGPKALLEYADALRRLDDAGVEGLFKLVSGRPRLAAAVELWTAAAMGLLDLDPPARMRPGSTAKAAAEATARRLLGGTVASRLTALGEEWRGIAASGGGTTGLRDRFDLLAQTVGDSLKHRDWLKDVRDQKDASGVLTDG